MWLSVIFAMALFCGHTRSKVWHDDSITTTREAHREGLSTGLHSPSGKGKRLIIVHIGFITSHQTDMDFNRLIRMRDPQLAYNQYKTVQQRAHHNATDQHQRNPNQTSGNQINPHLYRAKEDPSLFYKNRTRPSRYYERKADERSNFVGPESWGRVSGDRVRYRQKGVVKIPYHGAVVHVKPNMTHYYRTDKIKTRQLDGRRRAQMRIGGSVGKHPSKPCVRCPSERTLVSTLGQDKVLLEMPEVLSCAGRPIGYKGIQIKSAYGPKFNTLIKAGSHIIISEIFYKNEKLKYCQYRVHVVTHTCPVSDNLSVDCDVSTLDSDGILCNFSCKDKNMELRGSSALKCDNSLEWTGNLPTCQQRTWCEFPLAPDNGSLRCNANTFAGNRLAEGSKCRALCERGYVARPRLTACRRGQWTNAIVCRRRRRHARQPHH